MNNLTQEIIESYKSRHSFLLKLNQEDMKYISKSVVKFEKTLPLLDNHRKILRYKGLMNGLQYCQEVWVYKIMYKKFEEILENLEKNYIEKKLKGVHI